MSKEHYVQASCALPPEEDVMQSLASGGVLHASSAIAISEGQHFEASCDSPPEDDAVSSLSSGGVRASSAAAISEEKHLDTPAASPPEEDAIPPLASGGVLGASSAVAISEGKHLETPPASPPEEDAIPPLASGGLLGASSAIAISDGQHVHIELAVTSCAKPSEDHSYSLGSSGEHHKAYGFSPREGELFKPSIASGEEHGILSNDHMLGHSPDAFEEDDAASDPAEEANWDMCILLYCDPRGQPYKCLDIRKALEELGHGEEIGAMGPLGSGEVWYLRLGEYKTLLSLVSAGSIRIKGRNCTVVEPRTREIRVKVHWVPFSIPISAIRRAFLQYGIVTKVSTVKARFGTYYYLSTTRCIYLCLMEGRSLEDIPRRLPVTANISLLVAGPYREPMCYKCRTIGHFRRECTEKRCVKCMRFCRGMCAPSGDEYEPSRDDAQVKVPVQEPEDAQVAHTVTCSSEKNGVVIRENAPVTEETPTQQPREVGLDAETDNAGMADQNAPSVNVSFECECYTVLPEEP